MCFFSHHFVSQDNQVHTEGAVWLARMLEHNSGLNTLELRGGLWKNTCMSGVGIPK